MNDPRLGVATKESRGLDVNDITQKRKGTSLLPPTGASARVQPIRPRQNEYDIINPNTGDAKLRMSAYGKNILSSRDQQRVNKITGSPAAGVPKKLEQGVDQIWP